MAFALVKALPLSRPQVGPAIDAVCAAAGSDPWSTRAAALLFLQTLWFKHGPLMSAAELSRLQVGGWVGGGLVVVVGENPYAWQSCDCMHACACVFACARTLGFACVRAGASKGGGGGACALRAAGGGGGTCGACCCGPPSTAPLPAVLLLLRLLPQHIT